MRLARDARKSLDRLTARDAMNRLRARAAWWLSGSFLAWSGMTLASVLVDYPEPAFHAAMMAVLAMLPATLFLPASGEPFTALVRRIDEHTALEAWLGYPGGPAEPLLRKNAEELLRVRSVYRPERSRPAPWLYAVLVAGLACFGLAQAVSVSRGYGFSLGWADKTLVADALARTAPEPLPSRGRDSFLERTGEARDGTSGVLPRRGEPAPGPAAAAPVTGQARRAANEPGTADLAAGDVGTDAPAAPGAGDPGRGDGGSAGAVSPDGTSPGPGTGSGAPARAPGYEGAGESLVSSPLIEYRAAFERAWVERTGTESALGTERSAALLETALGRFFASFDSVVAMDGALDPSLEALKRAWAEAFAAEADR